jgi:hypothetical protein
MKDIIEEICITISITILFVCGEREKKNNKRHFESAKKETFI